MSEPTWTQQEGIDLCTAIQNLPSELFNCHPALTGGLLYKIGPRKDCDIVIYQRGDTDGERPEINWTGLWAALKGVGLEMVTDYGYVKKCTYRGKTVDVFERQQILLSLRAMVFANNSGAFTREQQLVSMAISIEQTIAALEAELGEPDEEAVGEIALLMAQVAMRTG